MTVLADESFPWIVVVDSMDAVNPNDVADTMLKLHCEQSSLQALVEGPQPGVVVSSCELTTASNGPVDRG